jgi:UPF0755 protein
MRYSVLTRSAFVVAAAVLFAACFGGPRVPAVWVEIPADAPISAIAESLAVHGIIESAAEFQRRVVDGNSYRDIKPGVYALRPGSSPAHVMRILRRGHPPVAKVVIRERMTMFEVAEELQRSLGLDVASVLAASRDSALCARVGARGGSLEGYAFPTAYYVNRSATPIQALRQMADTFEARWDRTWYGRLDSMGVTRDEVVTLASIIAGEMPHPEDLLRVSAVYHNRLQRGMRLQADPTVVYALGERRRLTNRDYQVRSAYNTYTIRGLPPGPIGSPSTESMRAALYPADSDDLFFVGRRDGRHEFSRTYREHLKTIAVLRTPKRVTTRQRPRGSDPLPSPDKAPHPPL